MKIREAPWLSVVVTCMGRLEHLRRSIPVFLKESPGVDVVLVDWTCPEHCGAYARDHWPEVRVIEVPGRTYFHKCAALNAGVRAATAPWLAIFDADMIASDNFFKEIRARLRSDVLLGLADERMAGFLVCARETFARTGGYDERMEGWGFEDDDMRRRLLEEGLRLERLSENAIELIPHGDECRTLFYAEKDMLRSSLFNQALVWQTRWKDLWLRREYWPERPVLTLSGTRPGQLFRSLQFALHVKCRIGVQEVQLLCASPENPDADSDSIERVLSEMMRGIDAPGPVSLVREPAQGLVVPLPFEPWSFPYFPARTRWRGWPDGKAYGRIGIGQLDAAELERLTLAAPDFTFIALGERAPIAETVRLLAEMDLFVDRGGGFIHLACAVGVPAFFLADDHADSAVLMRDELDLDVVVCDSIDDVATKAAIFLAAERAETN